jgi:iron complex outermembrane receptor protein
MKYVLLIFSCLTWGYAQQAHDTIQSTIDLKEVTISALQATSETPVAYNNLTKEDMGQRNLGVDMPILLQFLPGVVSTSDAGAGIGYTGIRVRGSDATRINVSINGIPYNDAESQGTFWVNLPDFGSSVGTLQLQRGVGTSTNGAGAFGASINLTTDRMSDAAYVQLSNSFGSFATRKHTVMFSTGPISNRFDLSGRLSKIDSDGYIDRASSDLKSYFLQGIFRDGNTQIKALAFGGFERTYQSWFGIDGATLATNRTYNSAGENYDNDGNVIGFYEDQVDNYNQDHYQLHWEQAVNAHWSLAVGLNYTYGRGYYQELNDIWYDQNIGFSGNTSANYLQLPQTDAVDTENITQKWLENDFYVANLMAAFDKGTQKLNLGFSYSSYVGNHFGTLIWAQNAGEALPNHRFYENKGEKTDTNVFAKLTHAVGRQWTVYADAQYRWIDYVANGMQAGQEPIDVNRSYGFFNPKAGVTYSVNPNHQLYFSVSQAHKEPNRTDFENGNPLPEELTDFELGWRNQKSNLQFVVNAYFMDYTNQLVLTGAIDEVGAPIRTNSGSSYRMGVELDLGWTISDQWQWQSNLSLSKNKNRDFFFERDDELQALGDTNLSFSPNVVGGSQMSYSPTKDFTVSLFSKYVGEQYLGNIDSALSKLASYSTQDVNLQYTITTSWCESLQLQLLLNNILDDEYTSNGYFYTYDDDWTNPGMITTIEGVGYYPQAGFHFMAGMSIRF